MALAITMVWEVRLSGNAANSGGFNSAAAGTDRSQQDAPHVDIDGVTITATVNATTTDLDLTGYVPVAADVGNTVRITGGTMTAGVYEITAIVAGRWRLDRSGGTAGQTGTGRMGGANTDPGLISGTMVAFNTTHVKAGTYLMTSATPNVAGGTVSTPVGGQTWQGYQNVRGDLGTPPIFRASGIVTATLLALSQNDCKAWNIEVDGQSLATIRGVDLIGRSFVYKLIARNCTNSGIRTASTNTHIIACGATGCTTAGAAILDAGGGLFSVMYGCWARGNTVPGFNLAGGCAPIRCISAGNTGATTDGFVLLSNMLVQDCIAYGNGRDGFRAPITNNETFVNCIAESNVGSGWNFSGAGVNQVLIGCAAFGNGSIFTSPGAVVLNVGFVTGTASFFVDPANGNFQPNSTVGGGADIRAAAYPLDFIDGLTTPFNDRGAVQHQELGGGGSGAGGPVLGQVWGGGA